MHGNNQNIKRKVTFSHCRWIGRLTGRAVLGLGVAVAVVLLAAISMAQPQALDAPRLVVRFPSDVIPWISAVACSHDGALVAGSIWPPGDIGIWDIRNGELLRQLSGHKGAVNAVTFSPDGKLIASSGDDGRLCLWRVNDGVLVHTTEGIVPSNGWISRVRFSPDGKTLALGCKFHQQGFWHLKTVIWDVKRDVQRDVLEGHCYPDFLPDGILLTAAVREKEKKPGFVETKELQFYSIGDQSLIQTIDPEVATKLSATACAPDGDTVACATYGQVRLLSVSQRKVLKIIRGEFGDVRSLVFSPESKTVAVVNEHRRVWLFDLEPGTVQRKSSQDWHCGVLAFTPDGSTLVVGKEAMELRKRSGEKVRAWLQLLPRAKGNKAEWVTYTPDGYFRKSNGAGAFLRWRVNKRVVSFDVHAKAYDRPELVVRALQVDGQ